MWFGVGAASCPDGGPLIEAGCLSHYPRGTTNGVAHPFKNFAFAELSSKISPMGYESINFREGTPRDAPSFAKLDALCFPETIAFTKVAFLYHLQDNKSANIVAECGGNLAGFAVGKVYRDGEGSIVTIDVHPDFRKKGLGKSLLAKLEDKMRQKGAIFYVLQVAVNNKAAINLYEKDGYHIHSLLEDYYPDFSARNSKDAYLMIKPAKE